jgi:hypothetical protein
VLLRQLDEGHVGGARGQRQLQGGVEGGGTRDTQGEEGGWVRGQHAGNMCMYVAASAAGRMGRRGVAPGGRAGERACWMATSTCSTCSACPCCCCCW